VKGGNKGGYNDKENGDIMKFLRELKFKTYIKKEGTFSNWEENTFEV
jgi:hypothetical protein